jgi:hypothetical protein
MATMASTRAGAQDADALDEVLVGRGLVVVDHRDALDGVAMGAELRDHALVEVERHGVGVARVGGDRAEVAALVARRVGLERGELETEARAEVDRLVGGDQPAGLDQGAADRRRRGRGVELSRRDAIEDVEVGLVAIQPAIRQRVEDALRAQVEERLDAPAPGRGRGARGGRQQALDRHRAGLSSSSSDSRFVAVAGAAVQW